MTFNKIKLLFDILQPELSSANIFSCKNCLFTKVFVQENEKGIFFLKEQKNKRAR